MYLLFSRCSAFPQHLTIKAGTSDLDEGDVVVRAKQIITHEDYNRRNGGDYDIAVIKVSGVARCFDGTRVPKILCVTNDHSRDYESSGPMELTILTPRYVVLFFTFSKCVEIRYCWILFCVHEVKKQLTVNTTRNVLSKSLANSKSESIYRTF